MIPWVCSGCQPRRDKALVKHRSRAEHRCAGLGCLCGSCHPTAPVSQQQYETWMEKLGRFYIENAMVVVEIVKKAVEEKKDS